MPRIGRLPPETSETARDPSRPDTHHGMTQGRTLTIPGVLSSHWISVRRRHGCRTTPGRALALMCGLVTPHGSEGVEDPDAEEIEVRSAEHLAFQHLDLIDGSFHGAGAVRQESSPRMRGAGAVVVVAEVDHGVVPAGAGEQSGLHSTFRWTSGSSPPAPGPRLRSQSGPLRDHDPLGNHRHHGPDLRPARHTTRTPSPVIPPGQWLLPLSCLVGFGHGKR